MNKKLARPTAADYEKRKEYERLLAENKISEEEEKQFILFMNSLDWAADVFEENGKYGIVAADGEQLVEAAFDNFMLMSGSELKKGDYTVAMRDEKWGVLICDGKGTWHLEPEYDYIGYPQGLFSLRKDDKWGVFNLQTKQFLIPLECDSISQNRGIMFENGISIYEKNGKFGVIQENGLFTDALYDEVDGFPDEFVKVKLNGKWGYLDENSKFTDNQDNAAFSYNQDF